MKNKITDLRNILFLQLEKLTDASEKELTVEVQRSMQLVSVSNAIIDTAKVENEYLKITNNDATGFIPVAKSLIPQQPKSSDSVIEQHDKIDTSKEDDDEEDLEPPKFERPPAVYSNTQYTYKPEGSLELTGK